MILNPASATLSTISSIFSGSAPLTEEVQSNRDTQIPLTSGPSPGRGVAVGVAVGNGVAVGELVGVGEGVGDGSCRTAGKKIGALVAVASTVEFV